MVAAPCTPPDTTRTSTGGGSSLDWATAGDQAAVRARVNANLFMAGSYRTSKMILIFFQPPCGVE